MVAPMRIMYTASFDVLGNFPKDKCVFGIISFGLFFFEKYGKHIKRRCMQSYSERIEKKRKPKNQTRLKKNVGE